MSTLKIRLTLIFIAGFLISCDPHNADGRLVIMDGKYYRMKNTIGIHYTLEPISMDTIIVINKQHGSK